MDFLSTSQGGHFVRGKVRGTEVDKVVGEHSLPVQKKCAADKIRRGFFHQGPPRTVRQFASDLRLIQSNVKTPLGPDPPRIRRGHCPPSITVRLFWGGDNSIEIQIYIMAVNRLLLFKPANSPSGLNLLLAFCAKWLLAGY